MLVGLEPALVGTLVRQQFDGQTAAYAARYPKARYLIVETGGMPIGRMVIDQTTDAITLVDIALLAAWRGRGVGGAVLREILDTAADQGLPVRLRVAVDSPARRLYARLGFAVVAATEMHREMVWTPTYYGRADH